MSWNGRYSATVTVIEGLGGIDAIAGVFEELGLGKPTAAMKASVQVASGSEETDSYTPREVTLISDAIKARSITVVDVILALEKRGFASENIFLVGLNPLRLRLTGYLPSFSTGVVPFPGHPVYVLESGKFYDPAWFYDSPLPSRFDPISFVAA